MNDAAGGQEEEGSLERDARLVQQLQEDGVEIMSVLAGFIQESSGRTFLTLMTRNSAEEESKAPL